MKKIFLFLFLLFTPFFTAFASVTIPEPTFSIVGYSNNNPIYAGTYQNRTTNSVEAYCSKQNLTYVSHTVGQSSLGSRAYYDPSNDTVSDAGLPYTDYVSSITCELKSENKNVTFDNPKGSDIGLTDDLSDLYFFFASYDTHTSERTAKEFCYRKKSNFVSMKTSSGTPNNYIAYQNFEFSKYSKVTDTYISQIVCTAPREFGEEDLQGLINQSSTDTYVIGYYLSYILYVNTIILFFIVLFGSYLMLNSIILGGRK